MDPSSFVGNRLSLDCGDTLGTFQGEVTAVSKEQQTISLRNTYRNGLKYEVPEVTIRAEDIKDLKIIKIADEKGDKTEEYQKVGNQNVSNGQNTEKKRLDRKSHSKSPVLRYTHKPGTASQGATPQKSHKGHSSSVPPQGHTARGNNRGQQSSICAALNLEDGDKDYQNNPRIPRSKSFSNSTRSHRDGNQTPEKQRHGRKGFQFYQGGDSTDDEIGGRFDRGRKKHFCGNLNQRYRASPQKIEGKRRSTAQMKNDECFSAPVESFLDDFDFEKNFALFDKAAVFEEMDAMEYTASNPNKTKYLRPDENILQGSMTPEKSSPVEEYKTDRYFICSENGVKVPSVPLSLRNKIFKAAEKKGFSSERRTEIVGAVLAQFILQLLFRDKGFQFSNNHKQLAVAVLSGSNTQGALGVCCGRYLSQHNVDVVLCTPASKKLHRELERELDLYQETEGDIVSSPDDLMTGHVDMVINTVAAESSNQAWDQSILQWIRNFNKAPILSLDPLPSQDFKSKWSVFVGAPSETSPKLGNIFLCDTGIPSGIYESLGVKFVSPFGPRMVVPLGDT